jgi:hypothetical protein
MSTTHASVGNFKQYGASKSPEAHPTVKLLVAAAMAAWLAIVLLLGTQGVFVGRPGVPPIPILLGATMPLMIFFGAYFGSHVFRAYVLAADLPLGAGIQAWRVGGLGFLALYAQGVLPGPFAWPAGLGDIAIGLAAPWISRELFRNSSFATSRRYMLWNVLGIADLVVALSMGALCSGFLPGLVGNITTTPMTQLPLLLIPAYLVPFFVMLHFTAFSQARRLVRKGQSRSDQNV